MQLFTGNFVLNARFDRCNKLEIWPAPFLPSSACFDSKDETVKTAIEFSVIKIFGALNSGNSLMQRTDTKLTRFDPLIPISIAKNKSKKSNLTYCSIHHLTGDFTPPPPTRIEPFALTILTIFSTKISDDDDHLCDHVFTLQRIFIETLVSLSICPSLSLTLYWLNT